MRGLINNVGNRCATNSVLQCLHATHELRVALNASAGSDSAHPTVDKQNSVPSELKRTFRNMDSEEQDAPYDPKPLVDALSKRYSTIWPKAQYEADDVFRCVLNALVDDEDPVHKDAADLWAIPKRHSATCCECNSQHVSYSTDSNVNVYLSEKPPTNLQDYVDGYSESFSVPNNYCDKCKALTTLTVTTDFTELPKLLCFNVLRAQCILEQGGRLLVNKGESGVTCVIVKDTVSFDVTEDLDCSRMSKDAPYPNYELYGLIIHKSSRSSSHYEAFVKRLSHWYHANDATVELCSTSPLTYPDTLSNSYMLMYRQTDSPRRCALL